MAESLHASAQDLAGRLPAALVTVFLACAHSVYLHTCTHMKGWLVILVLREYFVSDEYPTREYFVFIHAHMNARRAHTFGFTHAHMNTLRTSTSFSCTHIHTDIHEYTLCRYFVFTYAHINIQRVQPGFHAGIHPHMHTRVWCIHAFMYICVKTVQCIHVICSCIHVWKTKVCSSCVHACHENQDTLVVHSCMQMCHACMKNSMCASRIHSCTHVWKRVCMHQDFDEDTQSDKLQTMTMIMMTTTSTNPSRPSDSLEAS